MAELLRSLVPAVDAASCMHCPHEAGGVLVYCRVEKGLIVNWALTGPVTAEQASDRVGQLAATLEKAGLLPPKPAAGEVH